MNSLLRWKESVEQAAITEYDYCSDEAAQFTVDMFRDDTEDAFETDEPDFSEFN